MNIRKLYQILILICFFVISAEGSAQQTVWVSVPSAPLKADKSAKSETLATLEVGVALSVKEMKGKWYHVTTPSGETGWIFRGKVSKTKPDAEQNLDGELLGELDSNEIILAAADTSRSIRGKRPEKPNYKSPVPIEEAYRKALEHIMTYYVTDQELEQFLRQGRIGEFSE